MKKGVGLGGGVHGWMVLWLAIVLLISPAMLSMANLAWNSTPNAANYSRFVDTGNTKPEAKFVYLYVFVFFQLAGALAGLHEVTVGRFKNYKYSGTLLYVGVFGMLCMMGEMYHVSSAMNAAVREPPTVWEVVKNEFSWIGPLSP